MEQQKINQYSPRKKKSPKIDANLALELIYDKMDKVNDSIKEMKNYTERIESAMGQKMEIDKDSILEANKILQNSITEFVHHVDVLMTYVDRMKPRYSILCVFISLLFACLMTVLWRNAAKDRDRYEQYYEYYQKGFDINAMKAEN